MATWARVATPLLLIALVLSGLTALVTWSCQEGNFPLNIIDIKSELKQISEEAIQAVVKPHLVKGFFGLEVGAVQKSLRQMAWVDSAEVRRVWPDKLVVSVKEKVALAKWGEEGILSTEGSLFYPELGSQATPDKLPTFIGSKERSKDMLQQYMMLLEQLGPINLKIETLQLSSSGVWQVMLDNGVKLILGKTGLNERSTRFVQVYQNHLRTQVERIAYIDLRYANGFTIGWKAS